MLTPESAARWRAERPFAVLGVVAIVVGGLLTAVAIHWPLRDLIWVSAYLVLVVGVAQAVFGAGQAWLSGDVPKRGWIIAEWVTFNLGNAGVIAGTLLDIFWLVLAGTLLFAAGIALFLLGTHGAVRRGALVAYRVVLGLIFVSSLVGLVLAATTRLR